MDLAQECQVVELTFNLWAMGLIPTSGVIMVHLEVFKVVHLVKLGSKFCKKIIISSRIMLCGCAFIFIQS